MNKKITVYIFSGLMSATLPAVSQTLTEEVVIDREITPVVRNSVRPGWVTPSLLTPGVKVQPLLPREYLGTAELTRSIAPLAPVEWGDSVMRSPYRGYASVGYFPAFNLGAGVGYRVVRDKTKDVGLHFSYDGSSWSAGHELTEKLRSNRIDGGADAVIVFRPGTLKASFNYTYSSTTMTALPERFDRGTQALNDVDLTVGWNPSAPVGRFGWDAEVRFNYGGFTKAKNEALGALFFVPSPEFEFAPAKDINFGLTSNLSFAMGGSSAIVLGVGLDFRHSDNFNVILPKMLGTEETGEEYVAEVVNNYGPQTEGIITLRPGWKFDRKKVAGRIGVRLDVNTGELQHDTHVAPDIELQWAPVSMFSVDFHATGGEVMNTNSELWKRNPWATGIMSMERSHINADINLALTFGSYKGFWATLHGGWSSVSDWATPVTIKNVNTWALMEEFNGCNYGLELGYAWRNLLLVKAGAEGATHGKYYRWQDNAKWAFNIAAKVRPIEKLQIEAGYSVRVDRIGFSLEAMPSVMNYAYFQGRKVHLGDTSNLFVGAEYSVTDSFGVFVKAENLLNHHWQITENVRSRGIHGLIGVQLKF